MAEKDFTQSANECRIELLTQLHELADHIERAANSVTDSDMRAQMLAQREYSMAIAQRWNQNGNPFAAPAGWKLVPMEPTPEQLMKVYKKTGICRSELSEIWYDMLAAAPDLK